MFKLIGALFVIMMLTLAGMVLLIIEECIRDHIQYRKRSNNTGKGSGQQISCDDPYVRQKTNINNAHHAWDNHVTVSRVAQEAHDTASRDSLWLHDDACRIAQESHDTAVFDNQAAVDLHDHVASDPGFGCCGPFF